MREANSGVALTPAELPIRKSLDSQLNLAREAGALIFEGALTQLDRNVCRVPAGSVGEKFDRRQDVVEHDGLVNVQLKVAL